MLLLVALQMGLKRYDHQQTNTDSSLCMFQRPYKSQMAVKVRLIFLLPYLPTCAGAYFIVNSCIIHLLHALSKTPDSNKSDRIICKGWELSGNFSSPSIQEIKLLLSKSTDGLLKWFFKPQFIYPNMSSQVEDPSARTKCPQAHIQRGFRRRQMNLSGAGGERPKRGQQQLKMCCSLKRRLTNSEF